MVSKQLVDELGLILAEEFQLKLDFPTVNRLANFLVSYFSISNKIKTK